MSVTGLYVGRPEDLNKLFNELLYLGYEVIGYKVIDNVLRLVNVRNFSELARDVEDLQAPGKYRIQHGDFFRHGPDSPKNFLYPSELKLFTVMSDWSIQFPEVNEVKLAFFGIKPCDLASIKVMDRVQGVIGDEYFKLLRNNLVLVVENCTRPASTCFCATMGTGPRAKNGFDLSYTRIGNKLVVEAGSELGVKLLNLMDVVPIDNVTYREFEDVMYKACMAARANFITDNLPEVLELGINSSVFKDVASRCLGCANCNLVCPTCFCFDVVDIPKLDGSADRVRVWDGCLNYTYAIVAGGHFRPDIWARYRHFVLHKFTYWIKQFGVFGCVGCGRCITWCPVGIDLRETVSKVFKEVKSGG